VPYHYDDYQNYLATLEYASKTMRYGVHTHVLMAKRMPLLATGIRSNIVPRTMQTFSRHLVLAPQPHVLPKDVSWLAWASGQFQN